MRMIPLFSAFAVDPDFLNTLYDVIIIMSEHVNNFPSDTFGQSYSYTVCR